MSPRRSARVKALDSSPTYADEPTSGTKRKNDASGASPSAKRGKKGSKKGGKQQQTIEDTMDL